MQKLPWLEPGEPFPDATRAWGPEAPAPGLLAAGGALDVATLLGSAGGGLMDDPLREAIPRALQPALLTLLALGIIIVVAKFILAGSTKAVTTSKTNLEGQTLPANPQYADPGGGGGKN